MNLGAGVLWVSVNIKEMLHLHGYGDVWENPLLVTPDVFCPIFKQHLIDNFTQSWRADVENNNEKLTLINTLNKFRI